MTTFAKTARVTLAVAALALTTAGAASADVQRPNDAFKPNPYQSRDYYRPGSNDVWSRLTRFHLAIGGCTRGCVI